MKNMPYLLILVGILIAFSGARMLIMQSNESKKSINPIPKDISDANAKKDSLSAKMEVSKKIGDDFEAYVVNNFDKKYFTIKEWRGDKYSNGVYAISNHFPDLEIEFRMEKPHIQDTFAIECKFRSYYFNNSIEWAAEHQLQNYFDYAAKFKIPVFVVIGVGGLPSKPEEVFIIPLKEMKSVTITKQELMLYKRSNSNVKFFWNSDLKTLE